MDLSFGLDGILVACLCLLVIGELRRVLIGPFARARRHKEAGDGARARPVASSGNPAVLTRRRTTAPGERVPPLCRGPG